MNWKLLALISATSWALTACAPSAETTIVEKTIPVAKKETVVSGLDSDPEKSEFQVIATKSYDGSKLNLSFRPNRSDLRILSAKRTKSTKADEVATFEDVEVIDSSEVKDSLPTAPKDISPWDYQYQFVVSHPSFSEHETVTVGIFQKKSLIVDENTKLSNLSAGSNDIELADLTIKKGKTLTLDGASVKIRAENLVAEEGSKLENMTKEDSEAVAPEAEPGHDGGVIRFEIENAAGTLQIFLRGAKGGRGTVGVTSTTKGAAGGAGADGAIGYPRRPREPKVLSRGDHQAPLVSRSIGTDDIYTPYCKKNPGPGMPGGPGGQGGPGGMGAKGGSTGSMDLSINSGSLTYSVELIPGKGGDGGPGGGGGPGGDGGPGGNTREYCTAAPTGPQGPNGPQGATGAKGMDGSLGSFCTFRNGTSFSCNQQTSYSGVL